MSTNNKNWKWYFGHYLFISTCFLTSYMYLINILYFPDMELFQPSSLEIFFMVLSFPSPFILWFWMVSDYFKFGTTNKKEFWKLFLFLGNVLGALVYFVVYWRSRFSNDT